SPGRRRQLGVVRPASDEPIGGPRVEPTDGPTVIADYPAAPPDGGPGSAYADRAVLFGIMALALDLIKLDQLVAGLHAWVANKTQAVGEVLRDQCGLDAQKHELVESLVRKHLTGHSGIPRRGLTAVALSAQVRAALAAVTDPEVQSAVATTRSSPGDPE